MESELKTGKNMIKPHCIKIFIKKILNLHKISKTKIILLYEIHKINDHLNIKIEKVDSYSLIPRGRSIFLLVAGLKIRENTSR